MTKHFCILVFLMCIQSCFLGACSVGSQFKEYKHLEKASFPHVNSVPTFSEKSREENLKLIQKDYDREKKELENLRDFLKSDIENEKI